MMKKYHSSLFLLTTAFLVIIGISCSRTRELSDSQLVTRTIDAPIDEQIIDPNILPEIPPPGEGLTEYFKVQLLALNQYDRALVEKERLQEFTDKTILLVNEGNLWKLQLGDFATREEASKEQENLRMLGWYDAFLVRFRAPVEKTVQEIEPPPDESPAMYYTVQLIATTNRTEVENMQRNLRLLAISDVNLIKEGDFWKIRVGNFDNLPEAEKLLTRIREMGFDDAWITKRIKH